MNFNTIIILLLLTLINQSSPNQSSEERPMRLEKSSSYKSNLSMDSISTKCKEKLKDTSKGSTCPCHYSRKNVDSYSSLNENDKEIELICCNLTNPKEIDSCNNLIMNGPKNGDDFNVIGLIIESSPIFNGHLSLDPFFNKFRMDVMDLKYLRISGTALSKLSICSQTEIYRKHYKYYCDQFQNLVYLDIRNNQLENLEANGLSRLTDVYLSGNCWKCFELQQDNVDTLNWLSNNTHREETNHLVDVNYHQPLFHDAEKTFCDWTYREKMSACASSNKQQAKCNLLKLPCNSYEVFQKDLPKRKLLLDAVTAREKLARDCSKNPKCICSRDSFGTVNVTCKNANLTQLPKSLPPKTTTLDVSNNKIKSLKEIRDNKNYKYLRRLYASDNLIESIADLNGSALLQNYPRTIDLRYNKLKKFELSYVKSILKTTQGPSVDNYLFSNEDGFSCDCSDIKEVQRFLQDYAFIIRDAADIFCKEDSVFYHSTDPTAYDNDLTILKMDVASICGGKKDKNPLNLWILIVLEVLLLVLILTKLVYDYWQYNTYGRMPWLARQICMGEMCKANQSVGQSRLQNKYDIESPSYNNFYKVSTWKRILCNPKHSHSSHSGNRFSTVNKEEKNYTDVIQFRPRRATKIPSTSSQSKKSKGSKKSSTLSQRLFVGTESRKISDTLTSCLKKNESFIDAGTLDAIPIQECNSTNRNTLATTHIEVHKKDVDESISNHSDSEILDITLNNITSSSHHQNIDRKRKLTNIPHIDTILLSKINDDPTEEDKKIAEVVDQPEYYETSRKASDISNISKLSYGSPKPKRGSASPLIECKSDSLGIPKPYLPPSRSHSVSPRTIPNGVFKPISSIDEFEAIENQRKESYNSTGSSHGEYDDVFEPISSNEDPDVLLPVS